MQIEFKFYGKPFCKQSARFRAMKFGEKTIVKAYQPQEIVAEESSIREQIFRQLPDGFKMFQKSVVIDEVKFVFSAPQALMKQKNKELIEKELLPKVSKPDLTDNLMKGLIDAMQHLVFRDDAIIHKVSNLEKVYGMTPYTYIKMTGE